MKKRIVCVLLTLIMLLSLVPMGASAASHTISEAAITVLKQMTALRTTCYHFTGTEFRTGYGTVCTEEHHFKTNGDPDNKNHQNEHTITELKADQELRKALLALDEKVNTFASANGLSLTQYQHDALVVFSSEAGTDWMNGSGSLKSAIINGCDSTELLNAMNLWTGNASNGNTATLSRRKVEVNMYMNGVYSNAVSATYGTVIYKANGGAMPQADYKDPTKYTFYYDRNTTMEHPVVPTRNGYKFLGWYYINGTGASDIAWTPKLTAALDGHTLTAQWQSNSATSSSALAVNYKLHLSQMASLYVYSTVGAKDYNTQKTQKLVDYLPLHENQITVDKDYIASNGVRWSHLKSIDGWVKVGASDGNASYTDSYGTVIATATVTVNGYLNVRSGAGTDNKIVGSLAKNDNVDLYEIQTVNGQQWGRSKYGWLCLTYTRVILKDNVTVSDAGVMTYAFTGKIKGSTPVKVHVEPGDNTNYVNFKMYRNVAGEIEKTAKKTDLTIPADTKITLTNMFKVNGETWAKATWTNREYKWTTVGTKKVVDFDDVTRSGWIKVSKVNIDPSYFTVVADNVNVRDGWGDGANQIFTLNKGVEIKIVEIDLIDENLWGHFTAKKEAHTVTETTLEGYVNLASKNFSRVGAPVIENTGASSNLIATVINTDSLKVRSYGASYATRIGTLSRGTTVAVWESNEDDWYKVDSNQNGVYDYDDDGWVFGQYLDIREGSVSTSTVTDSNGNKYETDGTGKGIVANTYTGVNVRTGPGTAYASNGKLLTGTVVEILETANAGKWGRVAQGWICMDYVTMVSYNEVIPESQKNGTTVDSYDKAEKTTTTAVYTGVLDAGTEVYRNPELPTDAAAKELELIRTTTTAENITIYELATVTKTVTSDVQDKGDGKTQTTTTTVTTYWARINDGWVQNPQDTIALNALDEKVHTQTGVAKLNVRKGTNTDADEEGAVFDVLVQGDQVTVTALDIIRDKVWGRIDTTEGTGWIRLDYMSEGEVYVKAPVQNTTTATTPVIGNTSSTGGYVNNTSGYRYTGKVIRANELAVRATPSTGASKTTSLKNGAALVIYETTTAENMAWGRCDAGWVYLYYVDLTPVVNGAVDARVVYNDNTIIYTDVNCSAVAGTYARMSVIDIYEVVGKMARTELGWVNTDDLL